MTNKEMLEKISEDFKVTKHKVAKGRYTIDNDNTGVRITIRFRKDKLTKEDSILMLRQGLFDNEEHWMQITIETLYKYMENGF